MTTAEDQRDTIRRLESFVCALKYLHGWFYSKELQCMIPYNEPMKHAAYCIQWANR